MREIVPVLLLMFAGCHDGGSEPDPSIVNPVCTSTSCASTPCTPGCSFAAVPDGGCPSNAPAAVAKATVAACPDFCGFFNGGLGCIRFASEMQACVYDCHDWGALSCYPGEFNVDYRTGGGVCDRSAGFWCESSVVEDAGRGTCLPDGAWGP